MKDCPEVCQESEGLGSGPATYTGETNSHSTPASSPFEAVLCPHLPVALISYLPQLLPSPSLRPSFCFTLSILSLFCFPFDCLSHRPHASTVCGSPYLIHFRSGTLLGCLIGVFPSLFILPVIQLPDPGSISTKIKSFHFYQHSASSLSYRNNRKEGNKRDTNRNISQYIHTNR